jgi:hypothetical protein
VPEILVPFLPIIEEGQEPFAMLTDLWIKHRIAELWPPPVTSTE